ncbi:hypothetical protein M493_17215 [Geobacillus genomosp. 3]|uniref:TcaA protein NTF2-like domain-containing protein n=1 Tax=Geobacillus genomosp. 3 TaxID=1921421 RepID=S6A430_GEOG3|nr:hypothetical protein [Geobacillus genomosp. 3]AGT33651.1 hypothetical protein M493_17215 [Geobacillus genomosp. 3]
MSANDPAKEALKKIISQHGASICSEPKRLQSMLHDMTTEPKGKIKALISAVEEGVFQEIAQYPDEQLDDHFYHRMVARLHQNAAIDLQIAEWAVGCWGEVLDKAVPERAILEEEEEAAQGAASPPSVSMPSPSPSPSAAAIPPQQPVSVPAPVAPIQPRRSKLSAVFRFAVVCLLLFGAYRLFFSHEEEREEASQPSVAADVAGEETENSHDDETDAATAQENTAPEQVAAETDSNLTSSVSEQQVRTFMKRYITLAVESINQRDFSLIEDLIDPNGPAYQETQNYLQHVGEEGITEKLVTLDVQQVEVVDESRFKVRTYEEYEINYNGESEKIKSFRSEFLIAVSPDRTLKVQELLSTDQINSYDIPSEDYGADVAEGSEAGAVESTVRQHYASISNDDFETAYDLFSSDRKRKVTMAGWADGLQHNIKNEVNTIEVTALDGESATAYVELTSYDDNGDGTVLVQQWGGYWYLIKESGRWVLDDADIQKLDSRVESYGAF